MRILFYSSVNSKKQFIIQGYYKIDICILKSLGFKVLLSNNWYDFLFFWKYDVSFIYFYRYGLIPAVISKIFFKRIYFSGGIDFLEKKYSGLKSFLIQVIFFNLCGFLSTKNIIVSNSDFSNCENIRFLFSRDKNIVSRHAINFENYNNSLICDKEKIVISIVWMRNIEGVIRKGLYEALILFREIYKMDPEYRMIVIGSKGAGSVLVEKWIEELGLVERVNLVGALSEREKVQHLNVASVYLQLSRYEGFGIAAIEALASGCLVIHSGAGGLAEGVGEYGLLWSRRDPNSILTRLFELLLNKEKWDKWSLNGVNHIGRFYRTQTRRDDFRRIILGHER